VYATCCGPRFDVGRRTKIKTCHISNNPDPVLAALAKLEQGQRDIMARIDRLQAIVMAMQTDSAVDLGAAEYVERREEATRDEGRTLTNLVYAMERQIQHLQTEIRDLSGGS